MGEIMQAGNTLFKFGGNVLPGNIKVEMYGHKMVIKENGQEVFTMKKLQVNDNVILVDYPRTAEGQNGRGWGILGMLIALYHGISKGCTQINLGSQIEQTNASMGFWGKFGIARMDGTPLRFALDRGIGWVLVHCQQRDRKVTDFVLM
jgi:hypothetical protein